jgi:epoxyqueuosine reductase
MTASNDDMPATLSERVKALALGLGFDLAGVASPRPGPDTEFFRGWLERGHAGEMGWLERRTEERIDPARLLPSVRSVVVVGLVYAEPGAGAATGAPACEGPSGRVADYAGGDDYHDLMSDRLRALAGAMEALAGRALELRSYVDTGPVLERVFGARAGLGWTGKNTCLIHPELGSRFFLGVVLSDLELEVDAPEPDHCGACRRCLDVCPTDAFPEPFVLDATRCISYTTIELRGRIEPELRAGQGDFVFGCDLCQDVCPWNQRRPIAPLADPLALRERLEQRPAWRRPALAWILGLEDEAFGEAARGTALKRARRRGLVRNALVAAGNARDPALRPLLERHADGEDALLAEHARWALAQLAEASGADER